MSTVQSDKKFFIFNAIVSAAALSLLAWLLIIRDGESLGTDLSFMPKMNAILNSIAALFLASGWIAIVMGKRELHRYLMVGAFAASAVFLVGYLIYHYAHGDTTYPADAPNRMLYFVVLISHIILSIPIVPLCLTQFYYARTKQFSKHRKVGRVLLPMWLYVSVTGVVIYFMLSSATAA